MKLKLRLDGVTKICYRGSVKQERKNKDPREYSILYQKLRQLFLRKNVKNMTDVMQAKQQQTITSFEVS